MSSQSRQGKFWKPGASAPGEDLKEERVQGESVIVAYNPNQSLPVQQQRERLPIFKYRQNILYCVEKYQSVIIVGETGSGKSTQLPQYLLETGYARYGYKIAVTQPRRVAAVTLANRVADERGSLVGREIGYRIRFDDCWDENQTKVKFLTDGMLIREIMQDPLLKEYSVIMLDEAHERSLQTDIAVGLLKKILKKRPELRLIVSSATLNAQLFCDFYNKNETSDKSKDTAVIVPLEGRMYPVDIHYINEPVANYVKSTVETVLKIHRQEPAGDILAFLTGAEEIEAVVSSLIDESRAFKKTEPKLLVLPMHGSLPASYQMRVFQRTPADTRKVVVATNIAEASITINGIVYVIDSGFVKIMAYNPHAAISSLVITKISQASATQRAGRAGRVRAGKAYRLYTEQDFLALPPNQVPEIQRCDLSPVILQMKALGIVNVVRFHFISNPPAQNMLRAVELLYALGAIDDNSQLTEPLGVRMAEAPLHPMFAKVLFESGKMECSEEIITIAAMTQIQNIFVTPTNEKLRAEKAKRLFSALEGDHLTLLNVYNAFIDHNKSSKFCQKYFLNYKGLLRAMSIRQQLKNALRRFHIEIISCNGNGITVQRCLTTGLFANAARLHHSGVGVYRTVRDNHELHIHPTSVLYREVPPKWVIFNDVIKTNREYMQDITVIEPEWLHELAGHYYDYGTDREIAEKRARLS